MEEKLRKPRKEKPHFVSAEKEILSKTEHELIIGIPPVVRIRPIVVEPQAIVVAFELEHVRIAVTVRNVWHAIYATARLI